MVQRGDLVGLPFLGLCLAAFARHNSVPYGGPPAGALLHSSANHYNQQQQQQPPPPPSSSSSPPSLQPSAPDARVREGDSFHLPLAALAHGLTDALAWSDAVAAGSPPPGTSPPPDFLTRAKASFFFGESNGTTFAALRGLYGLDTREYLASLATGFEVFASNSKSRQFFCHTGDRRLLIKTMSAEELRALAAVLGPYHDHLAANPRSLLVHYCGHYHVRLYRYETDEWEDIHFLVMRNLMADPRPGLSVRELYDVKGSTVGRAASEKDKAKETKILKDLDLVARPWPIDFGADKAAFMAQVERDVAFLRAQGVMDYSLLLGVCPLPSFVQQQHQRQHQQHQQQLKGPSFGQRFLSYFLGPSPSSPAYYAQGQHQPSGGGWAVGHPGGREVYLAGIIDILQLYNRRKQAETLLKSVVYKRDAISAVDPDRYAERFLGFVDRVVHTHAPLPPPPPPPPMPPLGGSPQPLPLQHNQPAPQAAWQGHQYHHHQQQPPPPGPAAGR